MADSTHSAGKEVNVGIPFRGAKDGYLQTIYQAIQQFHTMTMQMTTYHDIRYAMMVDNMINMITDPEKRRYAKELKKRLYEEHFLPQYPRRTADDQARAMYQACEEVMGEVVGWVDEFIGMTSFNTVNLENAIPEEMNYENKLLQKKLDQLQAALDAQGIDIDSLSIDPNDAGDEGDAGQTDTPDTA